MGAADFPAREWGIRQPGLSWHRPASLAGSFGSMAKGSQASGAFSLQARSRLTIDLPAVPERVLMALALSAPWQPAPERDPRPLTSGPSPAAFAGQLRACGTRPSFTREGYRWSDQRVWTLHAPPWGAPSPVRPPDGALAVDMPRGAKTVGLSCPAGARNHGFELHRRAPPHRRRAGAVSCSSQRQSRRGHAFGFKLQVDLAAGGSQAA